MLPSGRRLLRSAAPRASAVARQPRDRKSHTRNIVPRSGEEVQLCAVRVKLDEVHGAPWPRKTAAEAFGNVEDHGSRVRRRRGCSLPVESYARSRTASCAPSTRGCTHTTWQQSPGPASQLRLRRCDELAASVGCRVNESSSSAGTVKITWALTKSMVQPGPRAHERRLLGAPPLATGAPTCTLPPVWVAHGALPRRMTRSGAATAVVVIPKGEAEG